MNKKILTISLVAAAAITASVATAFTMRKDAQVFNHYAAAENEYRYTFDKSSFTAGTFDNPYTTFPFSLSKQTASDYTLSTIEYNRNTWAGTYAYVKDESELNLSQEGEIFSIAISDDKFSYVMSIGFRIDPKATFDKDSSYVSYTVGEDSKTAKFSYFSEETDGYLVYYASPSIYGAQGTVFSLKYVYLTYYC